MLAVEFKGAQVSLGSKINTLSALTTVKAVSGNAKNRSRQRGRDCP